MLKLISHRQYSRFVRQTQFLLSSFIAATVYLQLKSIAVAVQAFVYAIDKHTFIWASPSFSGFFQINLSHLDDPAQI